MSTQATSALSAQPRTHRPQPTSLLIQHSGRRITEMQWQQRLDRAVQAARRMKPRAWLLGRSTRGEQAVDVYTVRSSTYQGLWYMQYAYERGISCTCEAGQRLFPCKHAAKVALRLCREYRMPTLLDMPGSPYELFDGDELDAVHEQEVREPDLDSLLWMEEWVVVCHNCSAENDPGASTCAVCGTRAGSQATNDRRARGGYAEYERQEEYWLA